MKLIVRHEADEEFHLACAWMESEVSGLGVRFGDEVRKYLRQVSADPERERIRQMQGQEYRRVNLKSFPYFIAYIIDRETVVVFTISHSHRKPEHWLGRLEP